MNIVDRIGKSATAGIACIYQLLTGQNLYSETAKEDGDSYIFDAERTLVISVSVKGKNAEGMFQKISDSVFHPKQIRVPKSAMLMITDCGQPDIIAKAREALSGLVLPGGAIN